MQPLPQEMRVLRRVSTILRWTPSAVTTLNVPVGASGLPGPVGTPAGGAAVHVDGARMAAAS